MISARRLPCQARQWDLEPDSSTITLIHVYRQILDAFISTSALSQVSHLSIEMVAVRIAGCPWVRVKAQSWAG